MSRVATPCAPERSARPAAYDEAIAAAVTSSRAAQGLPPHVEDLGVIRKLAALLATARPA